MKARCLAYLTPLAQEGYSRAARTALTGGNKKFPHRLSFNKDDALLYRTQIVDKMSISGVQTKVSLRLQKGELKLTDKDGEYILKPTPETQFEHNQDIPANEHLTMLLANKVFNIETAVSACIRFNNGELAYITKRFDRQQGVKIPQEDFCQLSQRATNTAGPNFKYEGSYEELGEILIKLCPAYIVEIEKIYKLIVFNYVFSNGDAHLKNFSLQQSPDKDYLFSPAYDLLCTKLHLPNEVRMALNLFKDEDFETSSFTVNGFHTSQCFLVLAEKFGIQPTRAQKTLDMFTQKNEEVLKLIKCSFLTEPAKELYRQYYLDRLKALSIKS